MYRRVSMSMGGWKWGYPRGKRIGIIEYKARITKDGRILWTSGGFVCQGLTASNTAYYERTYPEAFFYNCGSIHNKEV